MGQRLPSISLEDAAVRLRPLREADAAAMASTSEAGRHIAWAPASGPISEDQALAVVREWEAGRLAGERLALAVVDRRDDDFVGSLMLMVSAPEQAEIAYWTRADRRERGYATRAVTLLSDWALGGGGFSRLWLEVVPQNVASRAVAEHSGFLPCRLDRDAWSPDGELADRLEYERLPWPSLPPGYVGRRPAMADAGQVAALLDTCELADTGEQGPPHLDELLTEWRALARFDLRCDAWLVDGPGGAAAAYAWEWDERPNEWAVGEHNVHPDHRGRGIGGALLTLLERRARGHAVLAPGARTEFGVFCPSTQTAKKQLFGARGFTKTREFHRMLIELDRPLAAADWPAGIVAHTMVSPGDDAAVHATLEEAFAEHFRPDEMTLEEWRGLNDANPLWDPSLCFLAWHNDQVVGAALSYVESDAEHGVVDVLGVRKPWRARGIGEALLRQSLIALRERGCRKATLGVDVDNVTAAQRLYERIGMRVVRRIEFFEKVITASEGG